MRNAMDHESIVLVLLFDDARSLEAFGIITPSASGGWVFVGDFRTEREMRGVAMGAFRVLRAEQTGCIHGLRGTACERMMGAVS